MTLSTPELRTAPATLSVQLYSVREALAADQAAATARLADAGLRWVEAFGLGPSSPEDAASSLAAARRLRGDLDAAGLRASSTHATFPEDLSSLAEELDAVGADTVFLPVPAAAPPSPLDAFAARGALDALADRLTSAAEELGRHGVTVGYHNHWWEWDDLDGRPAYERFLERCGPVVTIELDAYWAWQAGQDPAAVLRELGERAVAVHLKSGPDRVDGLTFETAVALDQVPFSEGAFDLDAVLSASAARWHVLECDHTEGDVFALLAANAQTLLADGRTVA